MEYIYCKWTKLEEIIKSKRKVAREKSKPEVIDTPPIVNLKNKREECCERISNREWIIQRNINPYLIQNNYINDLNAQNEFLIPKDSNYKENISLS